MKLYYDNLVPFMPDCIVEGEVKIPNKQLAAARQAMIMLSNFQKTHNVNALYESVFQVSIYANVDIVDLILSSCDVNVTAGEIDDLLDISAKNLFKIISPNFESGSFDYKSYAATLLYVAHIVLDMQTMYIQEAEAARLEEQSKEEQNELPKS